MWGVRVACAGLGLALAVAPLALVPSAAQAQSFSYDVVPGDREPGYVGNRSGETDDQRIARLIKFYKCVPADKRADLDWAIRELYTSADRIAQKMADDNADRLRYMDLVKELRQKGLPLGDAPTYVTFYTDQVNRDRLGAQHLRALAKRLEGIPNCPDTRTSMSTVPPATAPMTFVGGGAVVNASNMRWTETSRATGDRTFAADDSGVGAMGRLEAGVLMQWNEALLNIRLQNSNANAIRNAERDVTRFIFGVKAQVDVGSSQVSHDFPSGSVFKSNIDFTASLLGIAGAKITPQAIAYGLFGPSIGRETVTINFGGPITDETHWTPGITAGLGSQFLLPYPGVSMGVEWQHTWWSGVDLNGPAASPGFNYHVNRDSDTLGVTLRKQIN